MTIPEIHALLINGGRPAFPVPSAFIPAPEGSGQMFINCDEYGTGPRPGMTQLTYIATQALQGMIAASYGDEGYVPAMLDSDFEPHPEGDWHKHPGTGVWQRDDRIIMNAAIKSEPHRLKTSHQQRLARDAFAYAFAMLAEEDRIRKEALASTVARKAD